MPADHPIHLAVALDGAGWHPAAWRAPAARPAELLSAGYWTELVGAVDLPGIDFVTFEDALRLQSASRQHPDNRLDQVRGRLDAVLVAARVAPVTRHVGLVPSVTVTHTEPFHISKAIATLDYVSLGRAGVRVQQSARPDEAAHFGRRVLPTPPVVGELLDEVGDYVEVLRRLWDSWEDDAEIRDVATGRFIDIAKLHPIDFHGRWFSVRGPSITPRPPQGQPLVTLLAHNPAVRTLGARAADVVFVTPHDAADAALIVAEIHHAKSTAGRGGETVHVMADLLVVLAPSTRQAAERLGHLDDLAGEALTSDAHVFTGTPAGLADLLADWAASGLSGFRLRPAVLPTDLDAVAGQLLPELRRRGLLAAAGAAGGTLRDRLDLPRPINRYVTTASSR